MTQGTVTDGGGTRRRLCIAAGVVTLAATGLEWLATAHASTWGGLVETGLRNLVVITAALALAHTRGRRRRPAPSPAEPSWTALRLDLLSGTAEAGGPARQTTDEWVTLIRREFVELSAFADHLYTMADLAGHEAEVADDTFVRLDDLRWLLGSYVLTGSRVRRLAQLPQLLDSVGGADRSAVVRATGGALVQRIKETNRVTAEWLLAHRVALPDPDFLDATALLGRYGRLELEPTAVSGDPLYLLTCHIHDVLEYIDGLGDIDHPTLALLDAQLTKVAEAVQEEVTTAAAFNTALIGLLRETHSAEAA